MKKTKSFTAGQTSWAGQDASLEISLFEYGLLCKQLPERDYEDEYFCLYKFTDEVYDTGHITEKQVNGYILGTEFPKPEDIASFLSYVGMAANEWIEESLVNKISDLLRYWGTENIMGGTYGGLTKVEAGELINEG